jgi:hypothetical protein
MTAEIAEVWDQIRRPGTEQLQGRLAPGSSSVWLAVDPAGRRHILVDAPGVVTDRSLGTTQGMSAVTAELDVAGRTATGYVDVTCLDSALNETFAAVAADLIRATAARPDDTVGAVVQTLDTWRWFWGVDAGLSGEEAVGLFGELWFLLRWAPWPGAIQNWVGPTGAVHDFASQGVSVEVKTTRVRADGRAVHRIANLDQLADPDTGHLYLFSLQVMPDSLAANSLPGLVMHARQRLAEHPSHVVAFLETLGKAGYSPAHADRYQQTYRVVAEELFEVVGEFPRLTRATFADGLPEGIDNLSYTIDLAACTGYMVGDAHRRENATHLLLAQLVG